MADQVFLRCSICRSIPEILINFIHICNQSRKLSKIGPKFGRSFGPPKFGGGEVFQKLYARYHPCVGARRLEKFREDTPTSPKVIEAHTLNFRPDF